MRNRQHRSQTGTIAARALLAALLPLGIAACFSSERSDLHVDPSETYDLAHANVVAHAERLSEEAVLDLSGVPASMTAPPEPDTATSQTTTTSADMGAPTEVDDVETTKSKSPDGTGTTSRNKAKRAPAVPGSESGDVGAGPDTHRLDTPRSAGAIAR